MSIPRQSFTDVAPDRLALARDRDRLRQLVDGLAELATLALPGDLLMDRIVARIREMTGASGAVIELVDGDELEYVAATGSIESSRGLRLGRAASLSGLCVAFGVLQHCDDSELDRRVDREACRRIGARSLLVAPLMHRDEAVGVIKIVSPQVAAFGELDEYALRLCAGLVSGVIARHLQTEQSKRLLVERSFALQQAMAIMQASPTPTFVHDLTGRVELWNAACEALFGWPASEVVGARPPFLSPDQLEVFHADVDLAQGAPAASDLKLRGRDPGRLLDVRMRTVPLPDDSGQITRVARFVEDLGGERLRAASAAAEAHRVRDLAQHLPCAFVSIDAGGRVLQWNAAAQDLFGYTHAQASGALLADLIIPEPLRDAHAHGLARAVALRQNGMLGRPLRLPGLHRDGSHVPIELTLGAVWIDGQPVFDALIQRAPVAADAVSGETGQSGADPAS